MEATSLPHHHKVRSHCKHNGNIITMQCFCTESHCGCEDVIQAAITNATAQLERELAAIINTTAQLERGLSAITNATAQLEQKLAAITNDTITNVTAQLEGELSAKIQQQSELMVSLNEEISEKILWELSNNHQSLISSIEDHHPRSGTSMENPATSCNTLPHGSVSGRYWIQALNGSAVSVYCDTTRVCCDITGGWIRAADLDMTNATQQCPPAFRAITSPKRLCGTHGSGCVSTTFPVHGVQYSHVCGRIKGYQYASPDGFYHYIYYHQSSLTIDDLYVEGASLTYGRNPRNHIWTFAAAAYEAYRNPHVVCPCNRTNTPYTGRVPPFIGEDYFCDTGNRNMWTYQYYLNDPLWDGAGCGPTSTCCEFNTPPWFCKELHQPTTDDIELRLCVDEGLGNEDVLLEQYEIFVQ